MHTVAVTGGSGVLGAYVSEALSKRGMDVRIFDLQPASGYQAHLTTHLPLEVVDITDPESIAQAVKKHQLDGIVHCAALLPKQIEEHIGRAVRVNCDGVVNVLDAAAEQGCRAILMSTKGVYGRIPEPYSHPQYVPLPESETPRPEDMYERTKYVAEGIIGWYRRARGVSAAALRTGTQWGFGKLVAHHTKNLHSKIVEGALSGTKVEVPQGGDQQTDMIYYPDLAAAIGSALAAPELTQPLYNVGTGIGRPLSDFVEAVRKAIPGADIELGGGLDFMGTGKGHYCVLDSTHAMRDFNWQPEFDYDKGVADYLRRAREFTDWNTAAT